MNNSSASNTAGITFRDILDQINALPPRPVVRITETPDGQAYCMPNGITRKGRPTDFILMPRAVYLQMLRAYGNEFTDAFEFEGLEDNPCAY